MPLHRGFHDTLTNGSGVVNNVADEAISDAVAG